MDIIKGRTTAVDVAREHGLTVSEVEAWQDRFMGGAEEFLRSSPRDEQACHDAERRELLAKVGDLTLEVDAPKKNAPLPGHLGARERVSAVLSTMQAEGREVPRSWLCRLLKAPRSTAYYQPRPRQAVERIDEVLAERIRAVIDAEPSFGIRSVWARLRFAEGLKVNRKKVERVMPLKGQPPV